MVYPSYIFNFVFFVHFFNCLQNSETVFGVGNIPKSLLTRLTGLAQLVELNQNLKANGEFEEGRREERKKGRKKTISLGDFGH